MRAHSLKFLVAGSGEVAWHQFATPSSELPTQNKTFGTHKDKASTKVTSCTFSLSRIVCDNSNGSCSSTMSPQAKALPCQEILLEIFEYLSPGSQDARALPRQKAARREAQRSLPRLARVCRAFSAPALKVLWTVTDNLIHLLSILPSFKLVLHKTYVSEISPIDVSKVVLSLVLGPHSGRHRCRMGAFPRIHPACPRTLHGQQESHFSLGLDVPQ